MNFRLHARTQAEACEGLGSPLTARVLRLVADRLAPGLPVADRLLNWPADRFRPDAVALRFAGALHHLVLTDAAPALKRYYTDPAPIADSQFWRVIEATVKQHAPAILHTLDSAPQTNELRRSCVLIAAAHWLGARYKLPLVLSELGSSAGLNLIWDSYGMTVQGQYFGPADPSLTLTPEWRGALPPKSPPTVQARAGVDLNPLYAARDRSRILSYIWPDQTERLARTRVALALAEAKKLEITRANAIDWLESRLSQSMPQAIHLVYHTVTWQYFSPDDQMRGQALLESAGARRRRDEPLAVLAMEQDEVEPGAGLTLHLWPENKRLSLGRVDFHGRWVEWRLPDTGAHS